MNAALSKDNETVEFVWDGSHTDQVRIMFYDFANSNHSYQVTHEATVYARDFWNGLLESGFHREHIENFGPGQIIIRS